MGAANLSTVNNTTEQLTKPVFLQAPDAGSITFRITREDASEISHKLSVLCDTPDLQDDYELTHEQCTELEQSVRAGDWTVPAWGVRAVCEEMKDAALILRDQARELRRNLMHSEAASATAQARRFERLFS